VGLAELTGKKLTAICLGDTVEKLNCSRSGWANHFPYRNLSEVMGKVRQHAED
jgi:hypothetical protein